MDRAVPRALVSVSDKSGLDEFVVGLVDAGFEIVSTGGTRRYLQEQGIAVIDVSDYTGFPEIMDGRVKTLHPKVHGAILGRPDLPDDRQAIHDHEIVPFQLVVCNLYPFEATVARDGVTVADAIEQIDIGGPSMIRSAAKNHKYVSVVTRPDQYHAVLTALKDGGLDGLQRLKLATAAFEMTARYDVAISGYLKGVIDEDREQSAASGRDRLKLDLGLKMELRYGENPHQRAAFYTEANAGPHTLAAARQLHGKELSYNNLLDLDAAWQIVNEFDSPAAVVIKHNNPCGCGVAETLEQAFERAYAGDPISAFGSVIGVNRCLDQATAERLCGPNRFIEAVIAPEFETGALEQLKSKPTWKNSVRLLECGLMPHKRPPVCDYRRVSGGLLVQDRDQLPDAHADWTVVTQRQPTDDERDDLDFAWSVCKHVKSNAIVYAQDGAVTGVGAGQMSRLDSAAIAATKSGDRCRPGVAASDAFFPFRDGVDAAAEAGITAIIQPGGSRRDEEVIAACNEQQIAMIFTGRRHFKH
ncbi:MAG: bifunctional phosphoribosylaminoimidazolecarboxamide formyltransferase/IMP cyclohydrolase [Planctomycetaceae bacterium]